VQCDTPAVLLGETNVVLTCKVKARPELTALYWISDVETGTMIVSGDSNNDFWTSNMASI